MKSPVASLLKQLPANEGQTIEIVVEGQHTTGKVTQKGRLTISSGSIVVGDGLSLTGNPPLAGKFPRGDHPCSTVIHQRGDGPPLICAFFTTFTAHPARTWTQVTSYGEIPFDPDEGFGVDSASWGTADAGDLDSAEVVASGFGDGRFQTYLGRDALGRSACLVTDFTVWKKRYLISRA